MDADALAFVIASFQSAVFIEGRVPHGEANAAGGMGGKMGAAPLFFTDISLA